MVLLLLDVVPLLVMLMLCGCSCVLCWLVASIMVSLSLLCVRLFVFARFGVFGDACVVVVVVRCVCVCPCCR